MSTAVPRVYGENPRSDRIATQPTTERSCPPLGRVRQTGRPKGHDRTGTAEEDRGLALDAARTCVLHASEALHTLLQACTRARAVIENAPEPDKLAGAIEELGLSHGAADAAVRAARQRLEKAAAVIGHRGESGWRTAARRAARREP